MNMRLKAEPGMLTAVWTPASGGAVPDRKTGEGAAGARQIPPRFRQVLRMEVWPQSRRTECVERLAEQPYELYGLLKGRLPAWLAESGLWPDDSELADPDAEENAGGPEALAEVRERLAKEPLTALALRGLAREELLDSVFALWAEGGGASAETSGLPSRAELSAELARLEKKGAAAFTGEWLAEAASEGSLHQPGPLFLEVRDRHVPESPVLPSETEEWGALPGSVPRARDGLALIKRRAAEAAAQRARDLGKRE